MAANKIAIRNAIKEILYNRTDCNDHVYTSRPTPLWEPELPAICISMKNGNFTKIVSSPVAVFNRLLTIEIFVIAKANCNVEDVLDNIQAEVEKILSENEHLPMPGDLLKDGLEPVSEETDVITEGKIPIGYTLLKYTCSYDKEWPSTLDSSEIDEFTTANTRFNKNTDDTVDMDNTVTVRSEL